MCGYLILVALIALVSAGLIVVLAWALGVTALPTLAAVAVWSWVLTVSVMLFLGGAKGENDDG